MNKSSNKPSSSSYSSTLVKEEALVFSSISSKPSPLTVIELDDEKHLTKEPKYPYSGPVQSSKRDWQLLRSKWEDPNYIPRLGPT